MNPDAELLRRYAADRAEDAFAELVRRHVNLVYSVALRQLNGDAHLAADATQLVFTDLARKAQAVAGESILAGWLFTSTRYAAAKLVRTEQRRQAREQEAYRMQDISSPDANDALDWTRVRPVLDDVIGALGARDREAILLRFFESRDYPDVGARLNLTANTARMRVERALDKLRALLERRGVTSTTAALGAALAQHAVTAAPAGLAVSVAGVATSAAAAGGIAAAVGFLGMTKLQWGLAGAIAIAGAAGVVSQAESEAALQRELQALRRQGDGVAALRAENVQLARMAAEVADLRRDDAAFARLRDETELLQKRLHAEATAQTAAGSAAAAGALNPSRVDRLPRPSFQARPRYPAELRRAGIGGEVQVEFIVDANGTVQNAFASKSTRPEFEAFAVEAVSKWRYQPGMKGGRAVFTKMSVPIVFSVGEMPVRPPPGPAEPPPNSVNLAPFHVVTTPVENTPAATAPRKSEPPAAQPAEWF